MDELKRLVATLGDDMQENTTAVKDLRTIQARMIVSFRKMRQAQVRSRAVIAVLAVIALVLGLVAWRINSVVDCIHDWATATGERSGVLSDLSTTRSNALDALVRDVGRQPPDKVKTATDYATYIAASDAYKKASVSHPVPKVSTFGCNFPF